MVVTSATTPATTSRCARAEMPSATSAEPIAAPATVPTLKPAWKRGMIARPRRCSTAVPSTFIATSHVPMPTPSRNSPATTGTTPMR